MTQRLALDPVIEVINLLSRWAWHQVVALSTTWMNRWIFVPIRWPAAVARLYSLSRDLAWSIAALLVILAILRSMWPELAIPGGHMPIRLFFERMAAAALISTAGLWGVEMMVSVNNGVVSALVQNAAVWHFAVQPVSGILTPFLALVVAIAMMALILYLAVFYAIRAIELFVLTAAIPWFALWWASSRNDMPLINLFKELVVVIFVQSLHAAAFWLVMHVAISGSLSLLNAFLELALLWYMTKLPAQFRRLMGIGLGAKELWR